MKKPFLTLLTLFLLLSFSTAFADRKIIVTAKDSMAVERRIALVIGNSNYKSSPLRNPVNDATDMAAALSRLGFQVTLGKDMTRKEMRSAIRTFGKNLRQGGVGLFYFAGHGIQVKGKNYLVPTDADVEEEYEVQDETIDAGTVLRNMEAAGNAMNMVFMDACRDNPFARSFRSGQKGLAQMDAPSGSLIVYATAPGSVAADGVGERNGIFTKHLLANIDTPGLPIEQVLKRVRVGVRRETGGKQTPWESSSLEGNFYFVPGSGTAAAPGLAIPIPPVVKIPASPVFQAPVESELDRKIRKAKELTAGIERQFAKLEEMDQLDDFVFSPADKKREWKEFIKKYPGNNPMMKTAREKLVRLELGESIERDFHDATKAIEKGMSPFLAVTEWQRFLDKYSVMPKHPMMVKASENIDDKQTELDLAREQVCNDRCWDRHTACVNKADNQYELCGEVPSGGWRERSCHGRAQKRRGECFDVNRRCGERCEAL